MIFRYFVVPCLAAAAFPAVVLLCGVTNLFVIGGLACVGVVMADRLSISPLGSRRSRF